MRLNRRVEFEIHGLLRECKTMQARRQIQSPRSRASARVSERGSIRCRPLRTSDAICAVLAGSLEGLQTQKNVTFLAAQHGIIAANLDWRFAWRGWRRVATRHCQSQSSFNEPRPCECRLQSRRGRKRTSLSLSLSRQPRALASADLSESVKSQDSTTHPHRAWWTSKNR